MAETNGITPHAINHLHIHGAHVEVWASEPHDNGRRTISLTIPAPRVPDDQSRVVAFLDDVDALRKLRDDCASVLARIEG